MFVFTIKHFVVISKCTKGKEMILRHEKGRENNAVRELGCESRCP